jgi:hypothetical protein
MWWTVRATPRAALSPSKPTEYPLYKKLDATHGGAGFVRITENLLSSPVFEPQTVQSVTSPYTNYPISPKCMKGTQRLRVAFLKTFKFIESSPVNFHCKPTNPNATKTHSLPSHTIGVCSSLTKLRCNASLCKTIFNICYFPVGLSTALQAGRSRVLFPTVSGNYHWHNPHYGPGVDWASNRNK